MHEDFETRVLPVVTAIAKKRIRDEQRQQDAIGLCWYEYQQTPNCKELPAAAFAVYAVLHTLAGRNLPGLKARGEDAMDHAWHCAAMKDARDPSPGPLRELIWQEEWEILLAKLTPRQKALLEVGHLEMRTMQIARLMGVTSGRVSQVRREIERLTKE